MWSRPRSSTSTEFEITIVFVEFTPRLLSGHADGMEGEREFHDDGTVEVTITARAGEMEHTIVERSPNEWPADEFDRGDYTYDARILFGIRNLERSDERRTETMNGAVIGTDLTDVSTPNLEYDHAGRERIVVNVGSPPLTADGDPNDGMYYAILTHSTIDFWGGEEPDDLETWSDGNVTDFTATELDKGRMMIEMELE